MASARDRERERDRRTAPSARTNEYFVPKQGIDREVITADICRYLGNDALVRPGNYENPQTRQIQPGYFITAYRNLTSAMIADLKADSERWENERRATATSRGQPANVGYRESNTHQSRQYYGPTEVQSGGTPVYVSNAPPGGQGQVSYNDGPSYEQPQSYSQAPGPAYGQPSYVPQDNYYVAGANLVADQTRNRVPVSQPGTNVPRTNAGNDPYAATGSYQQPDSRSSNYYPGQAGPPVSSGPPYPTQTNQDPYYGGRAAPPIDNTMYTPQDSYDTRSVSQDNGTYAQSQPPMVPSTPAVVQNTGNRRDRERDPEPRDRHRNGRR